MRRARRRHHAQSLSGWTERAVYFQWARKSRLRDEIGPLENAKAWKVFSSCWCRLDEDDPISVPFSFVHWGHELPGRDVVS